MKFNKKVDLSPKYWLLIFSFICLILLVLSLTFENTVYPLKYLTGAVITPMQDGISTSGIWINKKLDTLQDMQNLLDENEQLKTKLAEYESESQTYEQDMYELDRLRALYDLDEKYPSYTKIAARVIAKDSGNWFNVFIIDKGSKDGIAVDMNVLAGNGLAGIVIEVGSNYAKVRSIIDDSSKVSAMFLSTSDLCYVNGNLKSIEDGYIDIENIEKNALVYENDEIVTSHVSDKFLPGITIGYVSELSVDSNNLTKSAKLIPVVDFKNLQEVLVITELKQDVE